MIKVVVRVWKLFALCAYFLYELIVSSLKVAWDVITPRHHARPGIVAVPLDVQTDAGVMVLANLVSLTPGSLSLNVSADRRVLFVHVMFIDDVAEARAEIKNHMERRVKEALE